MGKVVFLDPIDHISGKIAKKFRTIYKFAKATGLKFTSISGERTTPVLAEELARRARFAAVAAAVAARKKDLSKVTTDTENSRTSGASNWLLTTHVPKCNGGCAKTKDTPS